jgi:hypothetical protein
MSFKAMSREERHRVPAWKVPRQCPFFLPGRRCIRARLDRL